MPPTKLRVKLGGIVKKYHAKSGVYTLQPELVNGYPTWKQNTSKNSVWFDISIGRWTIGWTDCLGSDTGGALWTRPWQNFFQYFEIMVSNGSMNPETLFEHG